MLLQSTAVAEADALVERVVLTYEYHFPNRIRGCFLIGSYADGTAVGLSDIDLITVIDEFHDQAEQNLAINLARELAAKSPIRLDVTPRAEQDIDTMHGVIRAGLKQGSVLVYGDDIRPQITLPAISEFTRDVIEGAMFFIARLHGMEKIESLPLTYPNANDEFFGYTTIRFAEWYPPSVHAGTKELVAIVSRIATATVAQHAGKYVSGKSEAVRLYAEYIGEPWSTFVSSIMTCCKKDWGYLVPSAPSERAELTNLCRQMLDFENDFLSVSGHLNS